ncbi:MAG: VOC family protein [FCB group bacterium]|nr:VOC family protein [FCB group bacterium]MBL7027257.1 VOC family protein [Candidatus Neomarinimicrobiota bacterium]MBL7122227.1 VOC family protein [Candidatus Neomarinimicrobiota bacterium]
MCELQFTRTGFILYVQKYQECIRFYRDTINLEILFDTTDLTCFEFGGSYLMLERGDQSPPDEQNQQNNATILRMNVPDVKKMADNLVQKGIKVKYAEYAWGTVANFKDPDGNACEYKDDEKFEGQIQQGISK